MTAYERELAGFDDDIGRLRQAPAGDVAAATQLAYRLQQRASLTGGSDAEARQATARAIERWGPAQDLCLLAATMHLQGHELDEAEAAVHRAPGLAGTVEGRLLLADCGLQRGREEAARQTYDEVLAADPTWDVMARIAHLAAARGEPDEAHRWYVAAEDELTAKQMRAYAWVRLHRGEVDAARGRYAEAEAHYAVADRAYDGWWPVAAHRAALLAEQGRTAEAIEAHLGVFRSAPRPETAEALGRLYAARGRPEEAAVWLDRALAGYLGPDGRGAARYHHHLAAFFTSARPDPGEAVRWARLDWRLRPNPRTEKALASAMDLADCH